MCDAQEDSADVTLQPRAVPQLLLGQAGHKPEILSLHLRIGFKEPEQLRMRIFYTPNRIYWFENLHDKYIAAMKSSILSNDPYEWNMTEVFEIIFIIDFLYLLNIGHLRLFYRTLEILEEYSAHLFHVVLISCISSLVRKCPDPWSLNLSWRPQVRAWGMARSREPMLGERNVNRTKWLGGLGEAQTALTIYTQPQYNVGDTNIVNTIKTTLESHFCVLENC